MLQLQRSPRSRSRLGSRSRDGERERSRALGSVGADDVDAGDGVNICDDVDACDEANIVEVRGLLWGAIEKSISYFDRSY